MNVISLMAGVNYRETTVKRVRFSSPSKCESRLGKGGEVMDSNRLSGSENKLNTSLSDYTPKSSIEREFRENGDKIPPKPNNDLDLSIFDHGSNDSVNFAKKNLHQAFTNKNAGKKHNIDLECMYDSSRDSVTVAKQAIINKDIEKQNSERIGITEWKNVEIENSAAKPQNVVVEEQKILYDNGFFLRPPNSQNKDNGAFKQFENPQMSQTRPLYEEAGRHLRRQELPAMPVLCPIFPENDSAAKPQNVIVEEQNDNRYFVRPPNSQNKDNAAFKQFENPQTTQTRPSYEEARRHIRRQELPAMPVVFPMFPDNGSADKPQNIHIEEQKIDNSTIRPPSSRNKDYVAFKQLENPQMSQMRPSYEEAGRHLRRQALPATPVVYPMFPDNRNIWHPEMPIPYFYGYTENRPIICQWHKSNNTKRQDKISDNGVNDKVNAIMSKQGIEKTKKEEMTEVRSSTEPTVKDLFEIIKKQNDRLEHLYEKVDRLLEKGVECSHKKCEQECCNSKDVEIIVPNEFPSQEVQHPKTADVNGAKEQLHQMSIGVMTSFEMVMTSTRHFPDSNAFYPQKNITRRSEIAMQKTGLSEDCQSGGVCPQMSSLKQPHIEGIVGNVLGFTGKSQESSKNEKSFSNIINLENYPSGQLSPERSMHLDMNDYSGIGSANISHSERGWTYFDKVVNNVDDMLNQPIGVTPLSHDCRIKHLRPRFTGIAAQTIDISVCSGQHEKIRPTRSHTKQHFQPLSETSIRINQLAKKYLKFPPDLHKPMTSANKRGEENTRMDYMVGATQEKMQYFERQRYYAANDQPCERNCGRFCHTREASICDSPSNILDIQALKQQPKFL